MSADTLWAAPLLLLPGVALMVLSTSTRFGKRHDEFQRVLETGYRPSVICALRLRGGRRGALARRIDLSVSAPLLIAKAQRREGGCIADFRSTRQPGITVSQGSNRNILQKIYLPWPIAGSFDNRASSRFQERCLLRSPDVVGLLGARVMALPPRLGARFLLGSVDAHFVLALKAIPRHLGRYSTGDTMKVRLTSGLLVALLAACAAPRESFVAVRPGEIGVSDQSGFLVMSAASDGRVPVVIRGDPFAGAVVNPDAAVAGALRLPPGFSPVSFVKTPGAEAGRGERLVLVFDAKDGNLEVRQMCRDLSSVALSVPQRALSR